MLYFLSDYITVTSRIQDTRRKGFIRLPFPAHSVREAAEAP